MTDQQALTNAAIDALLNAQSQKELCERAARNEQERDPSVAQALEADAQVHAHIIEALRTLLTTEQE